MSLYEFDGDLKIEFNRAYLIENAAINNEYKILSDANGDSLDIFKFLVYRKPVDSSSGLSIYVGSVEKNGFSVKLKEIKFKNLLANAIFDYFLEKFTFSFGNELYVYDTGGFFKDYF